VRGAQTPRFESLGRHIPLIDVEYGVAGLISAPRTLMSIPVARTLATTTVVGWSAAVSGGQATDGAGCFMCVTSSLS
jgi:hypothetical protein